jgi:DNA-binding transcriptional regulator YiaG
MQSADIPALKNLLASIATTVVNKASALTGAQVRFLRKRLNRRSLDFAAMISVTPQHLSKIECQDEEKPLDPGRDKLIRVIYRALSGDRKLKDVLSKEVEFEQWIASIHGKGNGERIVATWLANHQWRVEAEAA